MPSAARCARCVREADEPPGGERVAVGGRFVGPGTLRRWLLVCLAQAARYTQAWVTVSRELRGKGRPSARYLLKV